MSLEVACAYILTAPPIFNYFTPNRVSMNTNRNVVVIPYFIQETLKRKQLQMGDCLHLAKIKDFISVYDLAAFARLNENDFMERLFGAMLYGDLFFSWTGNMSNKDEETKKLANHVMDLHSDKSFETDLMGRLFDPAAKLDQYETPFITYDLSPEVCGVVIYPGFFCAPVSKELQIDLIEAILKTSYAYQAGHVVAGSPLFERYLALLGSK